MLAPVDLAIFGEWAMKRLKAALFLTLLGCAMAGSLAGCVVEDGRGGWGHEHHDWR
jgi:hypothetical protein